MYCKLIILFALAGCLSVASDATTTSSPPTTTDPPTSSTSADSTAFSSTSSSTAANTTAATEVTKSTQRPAIRPRPSHPIRPSGSRPRPRRPGQPSPRRPVEIPGLPIISGVINAINGFAQSVTPRGPNRGRPDPRRSRRSPDSVQITFNNSGIHEHNLPGLSGIPNISDFQMPNVEDMVPEILPFSDPSNLEIPEIPNLPGPPPISGVRNAVGEARKRVAVEINADEDLASGIEDAIADGLNSSNPTQAMRQLVSSILGIYVSVARKCPLMIVGGYVLREGLILISYILRALAEISAQVDGV